jgi:hypothetical protein
MCCEDPNGLAERSPQIGKGNGKSDEARKDCCDQEFADQAVGCSFEIEGIFCRLAGIGSYREMGKIAEFQRADIGQDAEADKERQEQHLPQGEASANG